MKRPEVLLTAGRTTRVVADRVPVRNPFPMSDALATQAHAEGQRRNEAALIAASQRDGDELLDWCTGHLNQARGPRIEPKSARDIVNAWFSHWYGRPDKPRQVTRKLKTHHVNRVAKWLEREVRAGRVVQADRNGKYGAKRYLRAAGAKPRRKGKRSA